jgi:recombinational DNA repair protein (RecF pathway)
MSNRTYACFGCRTTERVPASRIAKTCRKCRKPAHHVYYKFKIPGRLDDRAWSDLEDRVRPMNFEIQSRALQRLRVERARLERLVREAPVSRTERRADA